MWHWSQGHSSDSSHSPASISLSCLVRAIIGPSVRKENSSSIVIMLVMLKAKAKKQSKASCLPSFPVFPGFCSISQLGLLPCTISGWARRLEICWLLWSSLAQIISGLCSLQGIGSSGKRETERRGKGSWVWLLPLQGHVCKPRFTWHLLWYLIDSKIYHWFKDSVWGKVWSRKRNAIIL